MFLPSLICSFLRLSKSLVMPMVQYLYFSDSGRFGLFLIFVSFTFLFIASAISCAFTPYCSIVCLYTLAACWRMYPSIYSCRMNGLGYAMARSAMHTSDICRLDAYAVQFHLLRSALMLTRFVPSLIFRVSVSSITSCAPTAPSKTLSSVACRMNASVVNPTSYVLKNCTRHR